MTTAADVRPIDPPDGPSRSALSPRSRRLVGVALIAIVTAGFLSVIGFSRLDTAREEVAIATAVDVARAGVPADQVSNCFQGFCFEDDAGFLQKWWDFSSTYLRLIWPGLLLAVIVAGIVDGFVFRSGRGPAYGTWATSRLRSRADRRGTAVMPVRHLDEGGAGIAVGAMAAPAIAMSVVLFTPRVWGTRLGLSLLVGLVVYAAMRRTGSDAEASDRPGLVDSARDSARAAWRFAYRLAPLFVAAALLGGLGAQYFTVDGVDAVAGGHATGVAVGVIAGLLLDVPLTFGIPIAALALLVGADPVVVGIFLVSLAVAGPRTLRDLARTSGRITALVVAVTLVLGSFGTFAAAQALISATGGPTIAWDGEACTYRGPSRLGPGVHDFEVVNRTEDAGDGHTLAIVVGKLPPNVSLDHFAATVAADRAADLPFWFTVAGTREFVFPGTTEPMEITFHDPGTYAVVCLDGGGFYVIFEFSMPQPMGWFDEFRSTFSGHVAEQTVQVAG